MTEKEKYHEEKMREAQRTEVQKQRADIDYIAMMTDIDLEADEDEQEV